VGLVVSVVAIVQDGGHGRGEGQQQRAGGGEAAAPSLDDQPLLSADDYFDPALLSEEQRADYLPDIHYRTTQADGQTGRDATAADEAE
jgi:hypothetical protein